MHPWKVSRWPERRSCLSCFSLLPSLGASNQARGIRKLHKTCRAERSEELLKDLSGCMERSVYKEPASLETSAGNISLRLHISVKT